MQGEAGAARHHRIPAIPKGVGVDISQVARSARERLLRHPNHLAAMRQDVLLIQVIVYLEQTGIPFRRPRTSWKRLVTGSRGPKIRVVLRAQVERQQLEISDEEIARYAVALERFVDRARAGNRLAVNGLEHSRPSSEVSVRADTLYAETSGVERLAERQCGVVGLSASYSGFAIGGPKDGSAISRIAISRVP